jgi:ribosome-binding protein aMBF1 (putative translation factor)
MISAVQCKMARVALGWRAKDLAAAARIGVATVNRFEAEQAEPHAVTVDAIQRVLEAAGVEFKPDGSVRLNAGAAAAAGS